MLRFLYYIVYVYTDIVVMKEYKLGLALSGGSIKGFAHIGVLKYLATSPQA